MHHHRQHQPASFRILIAEVNAKCEIRNADGEMPICHRDEMTIVANGDEDYTTLSYIGIYLYKHFFYRLACISSCCCCC